MRGLTLFAVLAASWLLASAPQPAAAQDMLLGVGSPPAGAAGGGSDTTPDSFSFTPQTGAALSSVITHASSQAVAGISAPASISISGASGEFQINGGAWSSVTTTISLGDTFNVRLTTGASNSTTYTTTLNIGGVTANFDVTTVAAAGGGVQLREDGGERLREDGGQQLRE